MDGSINQFPEQAARDNIDKQLRAAGWAVQDKDKIDWNECLGIAIRGYQTDIGPTDHVLFVERKPVGIIEAKKEEEGCKLISHETQAENYATSKLKYLDNDPLPFVYESTGILTRFTDYRDPKPRSRPVLTFHRTETFKAWQKVTKSLKTDSRPLERKRSTSMKELLEAVTMGKRDEDLFISLAGRLARLEKQLTDQEKETFEEKAKGKTISETAKNLLNAYNPDKIEEKSQEVRKENPGITQIQALEMAKEILGKTACSIFNGELNEYIENVRKVHEQIIDIVNIDTVTKAQWGDDAVEKATGIINDFSMYMKEHKDEIIALSIFYNQPYRLRELTSCMVKDVLDKLKTDKPMLAPRYVWQAYEQLEEVNGKSPKDELVALVSLIRRVTGMDDKLTAYDKTVDRNFQKWVFEKQAGALKFNEEQMNWLRMMKEHIATSFHIEVENLDYTPFDAHGGRGMMFRLFGNGMNAMISEMNEALAV